MNDPKALNYGFIIIAPDNNPKLVELTASSVRNKYPNSPFICIVTSEISPENAQEISRICPTFQADNSYSSLINEGMKNPPSDWNLIVISGTSIRNRFFRKYSCFVQSDKDILFPVVDRKWNFVDATVNGIFLHRNTFKELGAMPQHPTIQECKANWAYEAINKGYKFKAVIGTSLV